MMVNYITDMKVKGKWYHVMATACNRFTDDTVLTEWLIGEDSVIGYRPVRWVHWEEIEEAICSIS